MLMARQWHGSINCATDFNHQVPTNGAANHPVPVIHSNLAPEHSRIIVTQSRNNGMEPSRRRTVFRNKSRSIMLTPLPIESQPFPLKKRSQSIRNSNIFPLFSNFEAKIRTKRLCVNHIFLRGSAIIRAKRF